MSETREDKLVRLFLAARDLGAGGREPFVVREAGGDTALAAEVLSLLRYDSPTEDRIALHAKAAAAELARTDPEGLASAIGAASSSFGDALPASVGRYRVLRALGRGGYGRVFLAEQDAPQRLVALKVAHAQASTTDRRRFRAEGEALARLQHPGIAQVYDAGVWREGGDRPYLVMEYIEGLALDDYAAAQALPRRRRMELLAQVCDAVAHAHRRGVIHRDLAPKNIMAGADGAPRVLDFGVARLLGPDGVSDTLARDGASLVGTLGYMSPEQLSGDPLQIDTRTDVYALGVIAYELLTGRRYLDVSDMTLTAALEAARAVPPARGSTVDPTLRGDLDAIVLKATERDPERRYPSASALAADIRRWLKDEPIEARPPSAVYRARKFARRHRAATAAAAALVVGLSAAAGYSLNARAAERESHAASLNALDAIITRVLSPLAPKLGSIDDRADLLALIGPDVERIAERTPNNVQAQRLRARFLAALGDIEDSRGSLGIALALREESLRVYQRLLAEWPNDIEIAHECSIAMVRCGNLMVQDNRADEARRLYEDALALDESQVRRHPEDLRLLSNLFWSYRRLSDIHRHERPQRARELAEKGAAATRSMAEIAPGAWRSLEAGVEAERLLAELAFDEGDHARAIDHARAAIANAVRLARLDPMSRHVQTLVATCSNTAIESLSELGCFEEAESVVADSAVAFRSITSPAAEPVQRMLIERMLLGMRLRIADAKGDQTEILKLQGEGVALAERMMNAMPGDFELCVWRANMLLARMLTLECVGRPLEVLADFVRLQEHIDEMQRLYADRPMAVGQIEGWKAMAVRRISGRWLDEETQRAEQVNVAER